MRIVDGKSKRVYDYQPLGFGYPAYVRIFDAAIRKDPIGWAFVIGDDDCGCLLVDMWVEPEYRGQCFGKDLIKILQGTYKRIWTGMSTKEGRDLCLGMGFTLNRGHFKRDVPKLEWEATNAKGNGNEAKEDGK
jgi:GNAT superfamily N-acetyltransferase